MSKIFRNTSDYPVLHPVTGQEIKPGQMYVEPDDMEHVEPTQPADSDRKVQIVADPESTQKAAAVQRRKTQASEQV